MHILITGAASGIARKVIEKLKKENVHIYVTTHTEKECILAKERYKQEKNITCFKLDITSQKDREQILSIPVDILICNAATSKGGSFLEINMDKVRDAFETNVFGNFTLVQMFLKKIIQKKGKVIMISSLAALVPMPFLGSYAATKASIIKITEALRMEIQMLNKNIDFVLIEPGLYKTGFNTVMLENKYDNKDTLFQSEIQKIRAKENFFIQYMEKKNIEGIANKIVEATLKKNPKKVYKAPCIQAFFAKIYFLFWG